MRVYHFLNRTYGLEDIRLRRLKVATIADLNDPFELLSPELSRSVNRKPLNDLKRELASCYGLLCFSKIWQNPVQWSHYSDKHRGLCLAFEIPDKKLHAVSYEHKRRAALAEVCLSKKTNDDLALLRRLSVKYRHWEYEQEARVFHKLGEKDQKTGLHFVTFSEELRLVGVIVGAMSDISRVELASCLGEQATKVSCFKARLAFKSFRVVQQLCGPLWV